MNKIKIVIFILLILLIGGLLRLYNLENIPNGFYVDEASTGYNAWSLNQTGKDEYGKSWPVMMRFLGSYTPPVYTYITALVMHLFGLSIFSTRLLSVVSGVILIVVIFLFIKALNLTRHLSVVLYITFLFSILPWSLFFSRIGYEVNLAFLFYSLGVLLLYVSLKRSYFLPFGFIFLSLSTATYHTERLLSPLTVILFFLMFKNVLLKSKRVLFISIALYILTSLPQIFLLFTPASGNRALGLFYWKAIDNQVNNLILIKYLAWPYFFLREFLSQYFSYFSPRNLFFQPDPDLQRSIPELSVFYPWMIILYLSGFIALVKNIHNKTYRFVLGLFLISPIPASLTGDPFSTQRALPLLLPLMAIFCMGLDKLLEKYPKKVIFYPGIIITFFSLVYLYRSYNFLLPFERAKVWGYGFEQLADKIKQRPDDHFLINDTNLKPPYIKLAFFLKYPPLQLQTSLDPEIEKNYYQKTKWDPYYKFSNIETRPINWEKDIYQQQIIVGDELAVSQAQAKEHYLTEIFEIKSPTQEIIFKGFKTNPKLKLESLKQ